MPVQPSILLDNNAMSHPTMAHRVQGKVIYLPDAVFCELFAKGQWEMSITHCLTPLASFADRVISTVNLAAILTCELATGQPTESIVGDPNVNRRLGPILIACRDEPDGAVAYFRATQTIAPHERTLRMTLASGARDLCVDIINRLKSENDAKSLNHFRNNPESVAGYFKSINVREDAMRGFSLLPAGADFECLSWDAERMASTPCCWMRLYLADLCLAVRRTVQTNFEHTSDDKLHADQNDREIVIVGTYADELLTFDKGAIWLDKALRTCLRELF